MGYKLINTTTDDLWELYNESAWTWEGMSTDDENIGLIIDFFNNQGCPLKENEFYVTTGKQLNSFNKELTGDNAYPDDLQIVSIFLDNITNVEKLFMVKFQVGARWFDDICENNWAREGD